MNVRLWWLKRRMKRPEWFFDADLRIRTSEELGRCRTPQAAEALIRLLDDRLPDVRIAAKCALVALGSAAVGELIKTLTSSEDSDTQMLAVDALAQIHDPAANERLREILTKASDYFVRSFAAETLGRVQDPSAVEALMAALNDQEVMVRWKAAVALGVIEDARAVGALIKAINDKAPFVRKQAAEALGKIGCEEAIGSLQAALQDENQDVRDTVAKALTEIRACADIKALGLRPAHMANLIEAILGDNDPAIRKEALSRLIAERRATEVLELTGISVLSDAPEIRRTALKRLDERGDTARVISLICSWRREGYLMAMAEQMNAEQRIRAAEIEAAFLAKAPLSSAVQDGPSVPSSGPAQFKIDRRRHSCVAEFCSRCQEDHCKCSPCRITTPEN